MGLLDNTVYIILGPCSIVHFVFIADMIRDGTTMTKGGHVDSNDLTVATP